MTNAGQLVHNLLLFVLQLQIIRKCLPFAAATYTIMLAERLNTQRGRFNHINHNTLHIAAAFTGKPHVNNITRNALRHKQNFTVNTRKGISLRSHRLNLYIVENNFIFSLHFPIIIWAKILILEQLKKGVKQILP